MEKLIGCIDYPNGQHAFIAHTLPWDGALGGRVDTGVGGWIRTGAGGTPRVPSTPSNSIAAFVVHTLSTRKQGRTPDWIRLAEALHRRARSRDSWAAMGVQTTPTPVGVPEDALDCT